MKIEVTADRRTMKTKSGSDMIIHTCYAYLPGKKYPQECEIIAPKGQPPYEAGMYDLAPESFGIGEYKALEVRPVLKPAAAPAASK